MFTVVIEALGKRTLSHPSQMAKWRKLRPGEQSMLVLLSNLVDEHAGAKA